MATPPSTGNYTLGRGVLTIGEWADSDTYPTSFSDMGNAPSFEFEITEETLDHFSSRSGLRSKDKVVTLETGYTVSFTVDEVAYQNILYYVKGTHTTATGSVDAFTEGLTATDKEYTLIFTTDNATGPNYVYKFYKVKISSNGAMGLISDEWAEIPFTAEGQSVPTGTLSGVDGTDPYSTYFVIEEAGTAGASTTTTTTGA
jgi:hypothetical protein